MESLTITDGREVAIHYIRYGTFSIDLIAVLPSIAQIILLSIRGYSVNHTQLLHALMMLRLLRLLRVVHLISQMSKMDSSGGMFQVILASRLSALTSFALKIVFSMFVLLNLMACVWWWLAVIQGFDDSWVTELPKPLIDLKTANNFDRWLVCAYYILTTSTRVNIIKPTFFYVRPAVLYCTGCCFLLMIMMKYLFILLYCGSMLASTV